MGEVERLEDNQHRQVFSHDKNAADFSFGELRFNGRPGFTLCRITQEIHHNRSL
jgi:hypothetical protein